MVETEASEGKIESAWLLSVLEGRRPEGRVVGSTAKLTPEFDDWVVGGGSTTSSCAAAAAAAAAVVDDG